MEKKLQIKQSRIDLDQIKKAAPGRRRHTEVFRQTYQSSKLFAKL